MHRDCLKCVRKATIINDTSTLRRHLEAFHKQAYRKWALENNFESKLPGDVRQRKQAQDAAKARQAGGSLDQHLREMPPKEKVARYTEQLFREAVVEWLIATDQPISAVEHPKFKRMIEVAAAAKDGVQIPSRKLARAEIMNMFQREISGLKKRLNVIFTCLTSADMR
ncbi:hypothetical protein PYCCODRAFT_1530807 [Trametes coccinea BRFM310]|uniref:BED-type domain-containing protein n=1 Tax=Trametes coccinea (strain BRFM310) TaxID=1353009 RepID=A0A1Y2I7S7_TRAC3|nr:hypothetical protein PYCCODRAFT_1530807 [Trametes coccinea BRFM310]